MPSTFFSLLRNSAITFSLLATVTSAEAGIWQFCKNQLGFLRSGATPAAIGSLTSQEVGRIQRTVNGMGDGFRLYVVGGAASSFRSPTSDIDYVVEYRFFKSYPQDGSRAYRRLARGLPGIDASHGILMGDYRPSMSHAILFEANKEPVFLTSPTPDAELARRHELRKKYGEWW